MSLVFWFLDHLLDNKIVMGGGRKITMIVSLSEELLYTMCRDHLQSPALADSHNT